jgi:hypothetical protein
MQALAWWVVRGGGWAIIAITEWLPKNSLFLTDRAIAYRTSLKAKGQCSGLLKLGNVTGFNASAL